MWCSRSRRSATCRGNPHRSVSCRYDRSTRTDRRRVRAPTSNRPSSVRLSRGPAPGTAPALASGTQEQERRPNCLGAPRPRLADSRMQTLEASRPESQLRPRRGEQQPIRSRGGHGLYKVLPAAMHRYDDVRIELQDLCGNVPGVIHRRRREMEPTDQGMQLLDTGNFLRLPDRVDHAPMTTRGNDDQAPILHIENCRMFVIVLVRYSFSC